MCMDGPRDSDLSTDSWSSRKEPPFDPNLSGLAPPRDEAGVQTYGQGVQTTARAAAHQALVVQVDSYILTLDVFT